MTENQNQNPADAAARSDISAQPSPAGTMDSNDRKKKRRVPLIPAILAGAALFIVGGLAGGAVGASTVLMSNDSGTSQGTGGPGGQPGGGQQGGGQQGGAGPGGGMAPGGQAGDGQGSNSQDSNGQDSDGQDSNNQGSDGQSSQNSDDQTADDTSAVDDSSEENVALTGLSSVSQEAAVLNREP
ncbi:hypothetical protein AAFP32_04765 [Brevibacterium sp. CBA3109]|uniref:Uncharacterized protein n=1 Tax=Brevibacterium koreense TaxID=3140787 RepID=A0AAU7UN94_9MICO